VLPIVLDGVLELNCVTWIYIARSTEMASVGLPFSATFHIGSLSYFTVLQHAAALHMRRVGQNHVYTVHIRYFWQGINQIYGHIWCIYTVLANPTHAPGG